MRYDTWIRGRSYRHGYRLEGDFIKRKFGKDHLFFKSEEEALAAVKEEALAAIKYKETQP